MTLPVQYGYAKQHDRARRFFIGLDLGQQQDYTALAIIERFIEGMRGDKQTHLHVRHLERYPLGTLYPDIVEKVKALYALERLRLHGRAPGLVVDSTGVGQAVTDMFKKAGLEFAPVLITGGDKENKHKGVYRVPKRNLVGSLQVALQTGRLKVAAGLELAPVLREELQNFKVKVNPKTAHDSYEHWRDSDHDDLVLAAALAAWGATERRKQTLRFVR